MHFSSQFWGEDHREEGWEAGSLMLALSFETSAAEISSGRPAKNERKPNINNSNCRTNLFRSVSILPEGHTVRVVGMFNQISIKIHPCSCTLAPSGYRLAAQSDLLATGFLSFSPFLSDLCCSFCLSFCLALKWLTLSAVSSHLLVVLLLWRDSAICKQWRASTCCLMVHIRALNSSLRGPAGLWAQICSLWKLICVLCVWCSGVLVQICSGWVKMKEKRAQSVNFSEVTVAGLFQDFSFLLASLSQPV